MRFWSDLLASVDGVDGRFMVCMFCVRIRWD